MSKLFDATTLASVTLANRCYGPAYAREGVRRVTFEKKRAQTDK